MDNLDFYLSSTRLRELRQQNKESHKTLAEAVGVSTQVIKNYESAAINGGIATDSEGDKTRSISGMRIETLFRIAKHYSVSTDYLLGLTNQSTNDMDLAAVCKFTGFSECVVSILSDEYFRIKCKDGTEYNNIESLVLLDGFEDFVYYLGGYEVIFDNIKEEIERFGEKLKAATGKQFSGFDQIITFCEMNEFNEDIFSDDGPITIKEYEHTMALADKLAFGRFKVTDALSKMLLYYRGNE